MKKIVLISSSIILSLILVESLLRFIGIEPWSYIESENPIIFESDSLLGWKAKEGSYLISISNNTNKKTLMTFGKRGNRLNEYKIEKFDNPAILFIGGSFTQGWGVNDEETFVSKIQNDYKNYSIYNFGQGGFGGVQSLIMLQKEINRIKNTKLVIYGFIEHHEYRNVARSSWLEVLSKYSRRGYSKIPKIPYATLDEKNNLKINSPIGYLHLPLRENSSIITLIEKVYMKQITRKRKKIQKLATKKIVLNMHEVSKKNNSKFLLVILDWTNQFSNEEYKKFFANKKINYVDCKISLNKETLVPGDYHPNAKGHTMYKECIDNFIKDKKLLF